MILHGLSLRFRLNLGRLPLVAAAALSAVAVLAVSGCGTAFDAAAPAAAVSGITLRGNVHGGQQPLSSARVYLFAAGSSGYASPSISLLNATKPGVSADISGNGYVLTDSTGSFIITGDYTCAQSTDQVYLLVTNGNPGLAQGTNNSAIAMMDALGSCGSLSASNFFVVNELSTVAAVTALQQFMADATHLGTSATNVAGLSQAVTLAGYMVNPSSSSSASSTTPGGNGTIPAATLHTLANILSACVNTASSSSSACSSLFNAATPPGGAAPSDTLKAMLNIAANPTSNVASLYALAPSTAPFQPQLATAPADWTLGIAYSLGSGTPLPGYMSIDGAGNVWIANLGSEKYPSDVDNIIKLSPFGAILSGTGYTNNGFVNLPEGIALADSGNAWVANTSSTILQMTNSGGNVSGFPFFGGNYPQGIALDASGNAWFGNYGSVGDGTTLTLVSRGGSLLNAGISSPGFSGPQGVALDTAGSVWSAGQGSDSLLKISSGFAVQSGSGSGFTGGGLHAPAGLAIDGSNRVWVVNTFGGSGQASVSVFNNDGTPVSGSAGFGTGQRGYENLIAIDGLGGAWVPSCGALCVGGSAKDSVVHIGATGTVLNGPAGFVNPTFNAPQGVAIDISGNLWVGNSAGQFNNTPGTVTELVGVAPPVKTPIQAALKAGKLGQRP